MKSSSAVRFSHEMNVHDFVLSADPSGGLARQKKRKVKATGTVKTVDGKQTLLPKKIELAKD